MEDFEIKLKNYNDKCNEIQNKNFENFEELEQSYCDLINEGGNLRKHLLDNPKLCNNNTILVLTNRTNDASIIEDKYKSLLNILVLTKTLIQKYSEYAQDLMNSKNYEQAIIIYDQIFTFTRQLALKQKIITIYAEQLNDYQKAFELCEFYEKNYPVEISFYELFAKISDNMQNTIKREYCYKKIKELKILAEVKQEINLNKNYKLAIEKFEELFNLTTNYDYKYQVANIYANNLNDYKKAIKYYEELGNDLHNKYFFWWNLAKLHKINNDSFKELFCMQKAIKLELNEEAQI